MQIRPPAVAGLFYPDDPARLAAQVDACLAEAASARHARAPKALIAPHAGYVYSGPIAGSAYADLAAHADRIERVVLIGPAHRVWLRGLAVPGTDAFDTPLGAVPLDREAIAALAKLPQVQISDAAHAEEHSLEVQLPFLQRALGSFRLVPLVAGDASAAEVAEVLDLVWGGDETLIVISSDLSHYLDYETARALDAGTARSIEALEIDALGENSACGRVPIRGLLTCARRRGLGVQRLDLRNSGDTAGSRDRVVGYGAWALEASALSAEDRSTLLGVARQALEKSAREEDEPSLDPETFSPALRVPAASFVTLRCGEALRGCIGSLEPVRPLVADVARSAYRAAAADPRFPRVRPEEVPGLSVHVSVLSALEPLVLGSREQLVAALRPGVDGLLLRQGARGGTFLPSVWQSLADPAAFLGALERKAGLTPAAWRQPVQCWRYTTQEWGN